MADGPPAADRPVAAGFPPPPPFYKLYNESSTAGPAPPPPLEDAFDLFGMPFRLDEPQVSTHPNAMIQAQPDGSVDYRSQLRSLVPELIPLFLELLRTLMETPESYAQPLMRVSQAMQAVQHLINMIRPPQARATLEYVLELEVKDKEEALTKIKQQVQAFDQLLQDGGVQLVEACKNGGQAVAGGGHGGDALIDMSTDGT